MVRTKRLLALTVVAVMAFSLLMPSSFALNRYSGDDRYETSAEISKAGWEGGSDVVILARGDNFADALAGIPLAFKHGAPVLLTRPDVLPEVILAEIKRLDPSTIYLLGGKEAISEEIEKQLAALGIEVIRIGGEDRYDTAVKIAWELAPDGVSTAYIVYSMNFPDALSAASYAAMQGCPILLTNSNTLNQDTAQALTDLGVQNTFVIGGTNVISNSVMGELPNPERIADNNRYLTSLTLAERFVDSNLMFITTGADASGGADALAGGALAAMRGTGILLVSNSVLEEVLQFLGDNIEEAIVFGGLAAVSPEVAQAIQDALYVHDDEEPSVPPVTPVPVSAISVEGIALIGATLTATPTPSGAKVIYQWTRCDTADGTYTNITGATSSTYPLVADDAGKYIKVSATGAGSYTGTKISAAVGPVSLVLNTTRNLGYDTIQAAITAASEGDRIVVGAGIYNEALSIDKSLTVNGTNGTIITRGAIASTTDTGKTLTVSGIEFKTAGLEVNGYDDVTISNNKYTNITSWTAAQLVGKVANAIYVHGSITGTALIQNNTISGVSSDVTLVGDGMGIMVRDLDSITITGNTISDTYHNSINVYGGIAGSVAVTNNILGNWDSNRDYAKDGNYYMNGTSEIILSAGCEGGRAIRVDLTGASINVEGNTFTPNDNAKPVDPNYVKITGYAGNVNNLIYSLVNNNIWPTGADYSTVILVNTTPGTNMVASITRESTTNFYPTIQAAVDAALDGDTIHVAAGTYSEEVKVNTVNEVKSITILGANATTVPTSNAVDGTVLTGGIYIGTDASTAIEKNVTVKGITFSGGKGLLLGNIKDATVENNKFLNITQTFNPSTTNVAAIAVIDPYAGGNTTIKNNYIDRVQGVTAGETKQGIGIYIRKPTTVIISGNHVEGTAHNAVLLAGTVTDAKVSIAGNNIVNWDSNNDDDGGRALRSAVAASKFVFTGNSMVKTVWAVEPADSNFVKVTDLSAGEVNFNSNYWNSGEPDFCSILADSASNVTVTNYYSDEAMENLVTLDE